MILKYLEKYHNLIMENKTMLEEERDAINNEVKKYENNIAKLKKENEAALEGFSPRIIEKNYDEEIKKSRLTAIKLEGESFQLEQKIKNMEIEISCLLDDIEKIKQEKENVSVSNEKKNINGDKRLDKEEERKDIDVSDEESEIDGNEIDGREVDGNVIEDDIGNASNGNLEILGNNEIYLNMKKLYESLLQNLNTSIYKIELCESFMGIDSGRSKLELMAIKRLIDKSIKEMKRLADCIENKN